MSKFLDCSFLDKLITLTLSTFVLPPLLWQARRVTKDWPTAGDVLFRAMLTTDKQPVADVLRQLHFEKVKEISSRSLFEELSSDWVIDIYLEAGNKGLSLVMVLIHHCLEGIITPVKGKALPLNEDLKNSSWQTSFDLASVEGLDPTNVDAVISFLSYEALKRCFNQDDNIGYYISTGKGRKATNAADLIRMWIDRGPISGVGALALVN